MVERIVNHTNGTSGGMPGVYNRFQYVPDMRQALIEWEAHLMTQLAARHELQTCGVAKLWDRANGALWGVFKPRQ